MGKDENRVELLLRMYDQMFNDINRHIMVVWQSVGMLVGAFAFLALAEKQIISIDLAVSLVLIVTSWLFAHLHDSAYWYNRNLVIIANIERKFLLKSDLKEIHYYFGKHRPKNKMITHLRIQFALGVSVAALILTYHFITRVIPGFSSSWSMFDPQRCLPYAIAITGLIYVLSLRKKYKDKYKEFIENSPGIAVNTKGIAYGVGHGFNKGDTAGSES